MNCMVLITSPRSISSLVFIKSGCGMKISKRLLSAHMMGTLNFSWCLSASPTLRPPFKHWWTIFSDHFFDRERLFSLMTSLCMGPSSQSLIASIDLIAGTSISSQPKEEPFWSGFDGVPWPYHRQTWRLYGPPTRSNPSWIGPFQLTWRAYGVSLVLRGITASSSRGMASWHNYSGTHQEGQLQLGTRNSASFPDPEAPYDIRSGPCPPKFP